MHDIETNFYGRSMRWYEWLLALLMLLLAFGVHAESVYKCTDAQGAVAYQVAPCAAGQAQSALTLDAAPAYAPSPKYATRDARAPSATSARRDPHFSPHRPVRDEAVSFECRSADGQVFYRHASCPRSIAASSSGGGEGGKSKTASHAATAAHGSVSVSAREISRSEACAQMHRAGSIGRSGHERDEDVSTYDRNLGRDPCR